MGLKIDVTLLFMGSLFRCLDFTTDLLYITTQNFAEDIYFQLSLATIICPPFIIFALYIVSGVCIIKNSEDKNLRQGLKFIMAGFALSMLDPTGIPTMIFACIMIRTKAEASDRAYIELITKITGFVEGLLESAPQAIIQAFNNIANDSWDWIALVSIALSVLSLMYTVVKIAFLCDKFAKEKIEPDSAESDTERENIYQFNSAR